jgi:4-coumarate--CoA ligase
MAKFNADLKVWESQKVPYPYSMDTYLGEEIIKRLKETPNHITQIFHEENSKMTFDDLRISSVRIAQNLIKLGLKPDEVVGVICNNSNEVTFLLTACILVGAPINPLDVSFSQEDFVYLFGQMLPKFVVCDLEVLKTVKAALKELKLDANIFVTSRQKFDEVQSFFDLLIPTGIENEFTTLKFDKPADEKIAAVLCSSGTTGRPKGVKITHAHMLAWSNMYKHLPVSNSLIFSPIFWATGFYPHVLKAFKPNDMHIMSDKKFSVDALIEIVEKYQLTHLTVPPMQLIAILQSNFAQTCKHENLKTVICIGSLVSESLRKKFSETFPDKNLAIGYGMTEISVCMSGPGEFMKNLSVGSFFVSNIVMKIVDEYGQRLSVGEEGEICVKPNFKFFVSSSKFQRLLIITNFHLQGYYNNPKASKNVIDNEGFFKTGDVGCFNENGSLFVVDRKKELMNYKGFQINPSEIENVIETIDGVKHVAVVGILDPVVQNLSTAVVVKMSGYKDLTEKIIVDYVAEKLPEHKQLHGGVYFVNELPMTSSGKVKKRVVLDMIFEKNLQQNSEKKTVVESQSKIKSPELKTSNENEVSRRSCCCFF